MAACSLAQSRIGFGRAQQQANETFCRLTPQPQGFMLLYELSRPFRSIAYGFHLPSVRIISVHVKSPRTTAPPPMTPAWDP